MSNTQRNIDYENGFNECRERIIMIIKKHLGEWDHLALRELLSAATLRPENQERKS